MDETSNNVKIKLRERQTELINIISSLEKLEESKEYQTIKELIYDKSLASIERQLLNETLSQKIDENKLYRLQGEWAWAKQHTDTARFVSTLKKQLEDIKLQLK